MTCDPKRPLFCRCRASLFAWVIGGVMLATMALLVLFVVTGSYASVITEKPTLAAPGEPAVIGEHE